MSDGTEKDKILEGMQELIAGIYIQQLRIYDLLAVLISERQPEKISELEKLHEAGQTLCPNPALNLEE